MNRESEDYSQDINECRCDKRLKTKDEESTHLGDTGLHGELEHLTIKTRLLDEKFTSVMGEYGLCVSSWLTRHPAKIEITRSSGGSSHHTKSFFCTKIMIFLVIHGEYIPPGTHAVNLLEVRSVSRHCPPHTTTSSCSGITSLRSKPAVHSSDELTIIATGVSETSVSADDSHSSKVRPESSSSTR